MFGWAAYFVFLLVLTGGAYWGFVRGLRLGPDGCVVPSWVHVTALLVIPTLCAWVTQRKWRKVLNESIEEAAGEIRGPTPGGQIRVSRKKTIRWMRWVLFAVTMVPPWDVYLIEGFQMERHLSTQWSPLFWSPTALESSDDIQSRVNLPLLLAEWGAVVLVFAILHRVFRRSDADGG